MGLSEKIDALWTKTNSKIDINANLKEATIATIGGCVVDYLSGNKLDDPLSYMAGVAGFLPGALMAFACKPPVNYIYRSLAYTCGTVVVAYAFKEHSDSYAYFNTCGVHFAKYGIGF